MAAVLEQNDTAAKNGSAVDEQIAQATSRIRIHDITFGGLVLFALVLVYTTTMIVLDRYLVLPEWVRQVALLGFLAGLAGTAYLTLVSPLRKRINPLYAAKQVERTIDDAKNSVTGYIDAQQKGTMNATVKAALASRAAKSVAEADVNKAVDHRSLMYLGGVAVAFLLALVVLFFVFRPAQFGSLVGRTFAPFSSDVIASRTQLTLLKPDPAEPTVTTGQSITVAVHVGGKVPNPDGPEKVRLLVRHNQADPNYDELPMVRGETARDWELRVPDYLVQNGFWYKVAAGDAVTPEYKVTVRSLPRFTDNFQATYEYPKYLRRKTETANSPIIRAYRGTTVTLLAKANRPVADGLLTIEAGNVRIPGTRVASDPESLQFVFKVTEPTSYKLTFNATNGERSEPYQSTITVDADAAPLVVITKPEEDETAEPANGQIKLDGKIGDDFGIATVTLKMKIVEPVERPLADVPYMNGKTTSFLREKDNTWPTDLDYKGSVDLATLKKDAAGLDLVLTPDTVIEYWLEATDNCTESKPNVGRSLPKRVRLTAPKVEETEKKNLDQQKDARKNEEKQHDDKQKKQLDNEKREPQKNGPQPEKNNDTDGGQKPADPNPDAKPEGKKGGDKGDNPPKQPGDPKNPDEGPKKDNTTGMGDKGGPMPPMGPNDPPPMPPNDPGTKPEAPPPSTPDQKKIDEAANDLKKELDKQNQDGGAGKTNTAPPEADRTDPAQAKPQPMGGTDNPADTKPEPKQPDPANPMSGKPDASAAKPQGDVKQPEDPSAPKPEEKKGGIPSEKRDEPFGAPPGTDKEQPKNPPPAPKDPNQKQDPNSGSAAKPDTQKKDGEPGGMPNPADKKDPAADAGSKAKPSPETKRGGEKPQPKEPPAADPKPQGDPEAGTAKPEKAPDAGTAKPMPKEGPMPMGMDSDPKPGEGANDPKKPNGTDAAEAKPDDKKNPPTAGGKPVDKGGERPQPKDDKGTASAGGNDAPMPKQKLDEKDRKELEQAAKDLTSPDPKKKQDARDKLDKAVGEENRKEIEQIAADLKSPDKDKRDAAQKKVEDAIKKADGKATGKDPEKKGDAPKFDDKDKKDIANAVNDLKSDDKEKQKQAQEKLDKAVGADKRKELEKAANDAKSDDMDKKAAGEQKLEDFKKEMDKLAKQDGKKDGKGDPKGKEPTPEELAELAKKAQDLQSKDEKTRQKAQKDLDEKIGKENREKLEEMLKNQKPGDPEQEKKTKEQLEQMAKNPPKKPDDDFAPKGPGSSPAAKGPMEEDKKNRLKTAELMLEEFEKNRYNKALQAKQGWTQEEMDKFLDGWRKRVEDMRNEAAAADKPPTPGLPDLPGGTLTTGGGNKVEALGAPKEGPAGVGGPTAAPPGFENARDKFQKALQKKP